MCLFHSQGTLRWKHQVLKGKARCVNISFIFIYIQFHGTSCCSSGEYQPGNTKTEWEHSHSASSAKRKCTTILRSYDGCVFVQLCESLADLLQQGEIYQSPGVKQKQHMYFWVWTESITLITQSTLTFPQVPNSLQVGKQVKDQRVVGASHLKAPRSQSLSLKSWMPGYVCNS